VDLSRFSEPRSRRAALPLKIAFVGRLVPYKGADMLLEAVVDFVRRGELELHIVGDGPDGPLLKKMAVDLGIESGVEFHGWVPHNQVQATLRECDAMALPSIREFGGAVVVEAMALAVAPIVADYAGPAEHVDELTGIKVPFTDKKSLIQGLSEVFARLIVCPEQLDRMGAAGREKALNKLTWEAKAKQVLSVYEAAILRERELGYLDHR
jgi:glycosyltransferase involved in cell wall biosynthesis